MNFTKILDLLLVLNSLVICGLILWRPKNTLAPRITLAIWILGNYFASSVIVNMVGGANLNFNIFSITLPAFVFVICAGIVLSIQNFLPQWRPVYLSIALLIAGVSLFIRQHAFFQFYFDTTLSDPEHIVAFFGILLPVVVAYIGGSVILSNSGSNLFEHIILNQSESRQPHFPVILYGGLAFAVVFVGFNLISIGSLVHFYWVTPFSDWLLSLLMRLFYFVIPSHLLAFAALDTVLDQLSEDTKQNKHFELIIYALIFGAINFDLVNYGYVFREFCFGLIFAYMYTRTKSLTYGIILQTLILHFTA